MRAVIALCLVSTLELALHHHIAACHEAPIDLAQCAVANGALIALGVTEVTEVHPHVTVIHNLAQ